MKQSKAFIPIINEDPKGAEIISHKYLLKGGYIKQTAAGIYSYLPLANKVLLKIKNIIKEELDQIGCEETILPILQPKEIWVQSERWDTMGDEMMRMKDRKDTEFALGPTHEEIITSVVKDYANTYANLPLALYQINTKFRDELRPRFGLMRGREFIMKDLYTFHTDKEDLELWYNQVSDAYIRIFKRIGIDIRRINADNGAMGGDQSHEFVAMAEVGEDTIKYCDACDFGANIEVFENETNCPNCGKELSEAKGIELGHIFMLGTKYSEKLDVYFTDQEQKKHPVIMGCYGLGVSRIMMAIVEQGHKETFAWPESVAPYDIHLVLLDTKDQEKLEYANKIYSELKAKGLDVLFDDRKVKNIGRKFSDADLIGINKRIYIGKEFNNGFVEYHNINDSIKENIAISDIITKVS